MKEKQFNAPSLEIIKFENEDIILTSTTIPGPGADEVPGDED